MKKILVIDDSPLVSMNLEKHVIPEIKAKYMQIFDPYKTREAIEEFKPDVVILDYRFNLPIDGEEIGKFIKENYSIPIIYHSFAEPGEAQELIDSVKPLAYIPKEAAYSRDSKLVFYSLMRHIFEKT